MLTKLLVIDDNLDNLISIKALLKNLIKDSVIMTALSGHEGVAIAKRELPDTILLDIQMPDLDGFAVCEALKSDSNTRLIPIILLTAKYVDTQSKVKGLEIGADAFLSKPIDENEYFGDKRIQVSIFMSVFNVHANWVPVKGTVIKSIHHNGRHMAAFLPKSSTENERSTVVIETEYKTQILLRQIAGALARRIVTYAHAGKECHINEHIGFIKFGSRVDIFFPLDTQIFVQVGESTIGNETIIARLNE